MTIEGEIIVRLDWNHRVVRSATVQSSRPFAAARVLGGRTPADAAAMVPLLFSVCGCAQEAAAAGALEAAEGATAPANTVAERELSVLLETIQEYFRRILIDWPQAMGRTGTPEPVAAARRLIAANAGGIAVRAELERDLSRLAAEHIYGSSPEAWLAQVEGDALAAWARRGRTLPAELLHELMSKLPALGKSDVRLMPAARREALLASVLPAMRSVPGFESAPAWDGVPVETGALARMHAHPVVAALRARRGNGVPARMAARLTELAALLAQVGGASAVDASAPCIQAFSLDPGEGLAAVQTARGLLLHRARVNDGRVTAYQIVAPTEWNFHPAGALVRGLVGLAARDEPTLKRWARLAVEALDPCVACDVEVSHA